MILSILNIKIKKFKPLALSHLHGSFMYFFFQIKNKAIKAYLCDVFWWLCANQLDSMMLGNQSSVVCKSLLENHGDDAQVKVIWSWVGAKIKWCTSLG